jgi:hypothetical protein
MEDKIVTFESYQDPMLAEIIRGRLEANGIDCFMADGNTIGANPLYSIALGGVKIKVFEKDVDKCKAILHEPEDIELTDEMPIETATTCPYCVSANVRYGASTVRKTNWLGALISFFSMTYPVIARKAWHCFNCGKEFKLF